MVVLSGSWESLFMVMTICLNFKNKQHLGSVIIMNSQAETDKRIFKFPTSQVKLKGKKSSYYEVIHSLEFPECNQALICVYKRIDMERIKELIEETPLISEMQKKFYVHIIQARYEKIIKASYDKLLERG